MSKQHLQTIKVYEERIKYLQLHLDHMVRENEQIKIKLDDMRITANQNKELLKDYINNITTKDKIVEKLQCTIEILQDRIESQDKFIKSLKSNNLPDQLKIRNKNEIVTNRNSVRNDAERENFNGFNTNRVSMRNAQGSGNLSELKEIFLNQKQIFDSLEEMKKDLQFIFDNTAIKSIDKVKKDLNCSVDSKTSTLSAQVKKINFKAKYTQNEINSLNGILSKVKGLPEEILFFVDGQNRVWELIERKELSIDMIHKNPDNLVSYSHKEKSLSLIIDDFNEHENESLNDSKFDISENTEFNNSHEIRLTEFSEAPEW